MFARISVLALFASAFLAAATPTTNPTTTVVTTPTPTGTTPASQCNNGGAQCCNSVESSSNPVVSLLAGLLGVVLQGVTVPVGITCLPILSGGTCNNQAVCCQNNQFHGVIAIGCSPINLSL